MLELLNQMDGFDSMGDVKASLCIKILTGHTQLLIHVHLLCQVSSLFHFHTLHACSRSSPCPIDSTTRACQRCNVQDLILPTKTLRCGVFEEGKGGQC